MVGQAIALLLILGVFGVLVPWMKGLAFLHPVLLMAYASTGVLFAAPAATEIFSPQSRRFGGSTLSRIATVTVYGWGVSTLMLVSGILTVNFANWSGRMLTPTARLIAAVLVLSAAGCFATVAVGARLSMSYGPKTAKTVLRFSFLLLLFAWAFGCRSLPEELQFSIDRQLTTSELATLAFLLSAVLTVIGAAVTLWIARSPAPNAPQRS